MAANIRPVTEADLWPCIEIGKYFHKGCLLEPICEYIPEDGYQHLYNTMQNKNKFFVVIEKGDQVVGFFIANRSRTVCNFSVWTSSEELFYLMPEHRSGHIALRCFRAWERWCSDHGTSMMLFTPTSFMEENMDRWDSFCHALGFQNTGKSYKKVLRHGN